MKKVRIYGTVEIGGVSHTNGFVDVEDDVADFLVSKGAASVAVMSAVVSEEQERANAADAASVGLVRAAEAKEAGRGGEASAGVAAGPSHKFRNK